MPNFSSRLNIAKPVGSDDFDTAEIANNWQIIDDHPGIHICTSSTRPTWGANQNAMCISETDTGLMYRWDGANFNLLHVSAIANDEVTLAMLGIGTAKGGLIVIRSANQPVELAVGTNGKGLVANSGSTDGVRWHYPKVPVFVRSRTSGNQTITSTSWTNVDTGIDITMTEVESGDWIGITVNGMWGSGDQPGRLDAMVVNSSNYVSGAAFGVRSWTGPNNGSPTFEPIGGEIMYQVVGGDISGGSIVLRLRAHIAASGSKVLQSNSNSPLQWFAKNYH